MIEVNILKESSSTLPKLMRYEDVYTEIFAARRDDGEFWTGVLLTSSLLTKSMFDEYSWPKNKCVPFTGKLEIVGR